MGEDRKIWERIGRYGRGCEKMGKDRKIEKNKKRWERIENIRKVSS